MSAASRLLIAALDVICKVDRPQLYPIVYPQLCRFLYRHVHVGLPRGLIRKTQRHLFSLHHHMAGWNDLIVACPNVHHSPIFV